MKPSKYKVVLDVLAQDWLDRQSKDVQRHVLLILERLSADPITTSKQLENPRWLDDMWGWARRVHMDRVIPGLRCIYYLWEAKHEMVIVKFGTHADDVYEDSN